MPSHIPEIQNVLYRLAKLERQNRRMKQAGLAVLVLATALVTIYATQPVPQKITAQEFDVVDNAGRVRVKVGMLSGVPIIGLSDAQGKPRAEISVDASGLPSVALADAQGKARTEMVVDSAGVPSIALFDAHENKRIELVEAVDGPHLSLNDAEENKRIQLFIEPSRSAVEVADASGKQRATLAEVAGAGVALGFYGGQDTGRLLLGLTQNNPYISLYDQNHRTPRMSLDASTQYAGLRLFDENSSVRVRLEFHNTDQQWFSGLAIKGADGNPVAGMGEGSNGPSLALWGHNGRMLFSKP